MPLGNPISLTQNVAQREIRELATEDQTLFTVDGGYMVNQLDVYRNGVLLNMNDDYTALDGSTVTLVNQCVANDEIVFRIYDNFRVADAIVSAASTQTISGNLVVTGELYPERINLTNINTSGVITATTFDGDLNGNATTATTAGNLTGTPQVTVSTITGVAATFTGVLDATSNLASNLTGTPQVTVSTLTGVAASFTGAVSIGGTLTYEDVTNVDSVGVITAQSGIHVLANGVRVATGATVTGAENILIFETDGFERVRVVSTGNVIIASGGSLSVTDSNNNASGQASTTGAINCNLIRPSTNSNNSWNGVYFSSRNAVGGGAKSVGIIETGLRVGSFTSDLSATETIKLNTSGYVQLRTTGGGAGDKQLHYTDDGGDQFYVTATGQIYARSSSIVVISSQRRLKENIVPLDATTSWETIKSTPFYSYNYIGRDIEDVSYGPMADEVPADLLLETGQEDDEGPISTYNNPLLEARLYVALQSALTRIETLEAQVAALEAG